MEKQLVTLELNDLNAIDQKLQQEAIESLESGRIVYLPSLGFNLQSNEESHFLSDHILDGKHKNVGYNRQTQRLGGFNKALLDKEDQLLLKTFMQRYADYAKHVVCQLFPLYEKALIWGRTSYRPAEIKGRPSSKRKDDTRLHVDSFPASPVYGQRILRVFCNVNPYGEPRIWHLGEPFEQVVEQFLPGIPNYSKLRAKILHWVKATKSLRSAYDHYQLNLHDQMKLNDNYQEQVNKHRMAFPAQSTWVVFTDQASHAALGGQFLLEQTFYLPVDAMKTPERSPLRHWEQIKKTALA